MFVLFTIVAVAVVTLTLTRTDSMRPVALTAIGALSIALGGRATALLTDVAYEPFAPRAASAQEAAAEEADVADTESAEVVSNDEIELLDTEPAELSDKPSKRIANVTDLDEFPTWTRAESGYDGDTYRVTVDSGAHTKIRNAERALTDEILAVANDHINEYLESDFAATLLHYNVEHLRRYGVIDDGLVFTGRQQFASFPDEMYKSYARLEFTPEFHDELDRRWDKAKAASRLAQVGLGGAVVLLFLGTVFGYFKLDTATRGYYTGRLQFGTAAVILMLVVACIVFAKWITWV